MRFSRNKKGATVETVPRLHKLINTIGINDSLVERHFLTRRSSIFATGCQVIKITMRFPSGLPGY